MNKKTLFELDFYRIRDEISAFCASDEGRFILSKTEPLSNPTEIKRKKQLGQECNVFLDFSRTSPLVGWQEVHGIFKMLCVQGISINLEQAKSVLLFCISVRKIRESVKNASLSLEIPNLLDLIESIPDILPVENEISKIITIDGQMRDLPQLREIHTKIASLNAKIRSIMKGFTSNAKYLNILETNVPVLRAGRQVLAVKSNRRSSIPGIIHEVSQSGQTVYIEPEESVRCANELVEAEAELQAEIRKILTELAATIFPHSSDLRKTLKIMQNLDCTMAAAKWGKSRNAVFADECKIENDYEEPLLILGARHPLLGEKAVPIDIRFIEGKRILIITGPNTGGKTVAIKTLALFAMLNQSGFPIPAKEGTRLPIFSGIFADIGDEQSLDQSLSTFSGHMKNIANAVKCANEKSLVLLDELGSGTDPQEGAAISMAVLDALIEKKSFVLITTHQGVIKNYGYTHSACINASVEFNPETLSPSYRILMGVSGESHALDIAKKSGLPYPIVKKAKSYIVSEQADVSSLIKGLSEKHAEADRLRRELEDKEYEVNEKIRKNDLKSLALRQKEFEIKQDVQRNSYDFLVQARKDLENLVRVLREGEITREKTLGVRKFISDLTDKIEENEKSLELEETAIEEEKNRIAKLENLDAEKKRVSHKKNTKKRIKASEALANAVSMVQNRSEDSTGKKTSPTFCVGAQVIAGKSNQKGTIVSQEEEGVWNVQFGSVKMALKQKELSLVNENYSTTPSYSVVYTGEKQNERPAYELRLLGLRAEEAIKSLEKQLDLCIMQDFKSFSIIHGKGTGVLQQTVRDYLSNCPAVKEFSFAPPEDGGFGKTYVSLR